VGGEPIEDGPPRLRIEEGQDVARTDHGIEIRLQAHRPEVEFGEVGHEPGRAGMVLLGGGDQLPIDVDADDIVTSFCEVAPDATWPSPGVEHSGPTSDHGVDETCLASEIVARGGHRPKSFDVPRGVVRIPFGQFDPPVGRHHLDANCRQGR